MAKKENHKAGKRGAIRPTADRVLIRPIESEANKTVSGIIIPDSAQKKESKEGTIIAVGPGKFDNGKIIPLSVKVGDTVLYRQGWDNEVEIDEAKHYLVSESDVLAVIQ
jgi:chaperonin GroES